jgi:putative DNA methylase
MSTAEHHVVSPRKLIEVALPLDAINAAAAHEKAIRTGHPANLHLWWARRPLAAARAVIFSQLVNDPEDLWWHQNPGAVPNKQVRGHWTKARQRLFRIIEDLVLWQNTTNAQVLDRAREEISKSWREVCELNKNHPQATELFNPNKMPGLHDPFAGGGAIPLEAQRLGLQAYASDLNPVAVLINKAMIEIPPKFAGRPPVHADVRRDKKLFAKDWKGAEGLAEDVHRYGQWMRDEAEKRIGHLYPKVEITAEMAKERPDLKPIVGQKLTVIAWIWARTVKSPNPAFTEIPVPLASTFVLATRSGKEAYVHPVITKDGYRFIVKTGDAPESAKKGTKSGRANFRCLLSESPIGGDYIKAEGKAGRIGVRLMAVVAKGKSGRVYLSPDTASEEVANSARPTWSPRVQISGTSQYLGVKPYGMDRFDQLFTQRQLQSLTAFAALVGEARHMARVAAEAAGVRADDTALNAGGTGSQAYADAIALFLACGVSKSANRSNTGATWMPSVQCPGHLFSRQAISMSWDFAETNAISGPSGSFQSMVDDVAAALPFTCGSTQPGESSQVDARATPYTKGVVISTDPPYYDNVPYADLSDFFYVWLRHCLQGVFPSLFATIAVPKSEELVAFAYRFGSKEGAEQSFLEGMTQAMHNMRTHASLAIPITIYYAFKQSDAEAEGTSSTGWETFLAAVLRAGLAITGTWPMSTERANRKRGQSSNALASSIILVCRPRSKDAGTISRRQFVRLLDEALPDALAKMTGADEGEHSPVAPVDLSQAIIGPGMAIFSRYDAVLEADGAPMTVKTALRLINRFLAEDDFDGDTQFCLHWFEQHGWDTGKFGEADTLARAKGTSVDGVKAAGVIESGGGNVRLLKWKEYQADWNPSLDTRIPVWEALHQLIRVYSSKGDAGAGKVLKACSGKAEAARQLAYRLYTLCERKGWAEDARAYNEVVTGWPGIEKAAGTGGEEQRELFNG